MRSWKESLKGNRTAFLEASWGYLGDPLGGTLCISWTIKWVILGCHWQPATTLARNACVDVPIVKCSMIKQDSENTKTILKSTLARRDGWTFASQRSLHNAPIFRLLLKVAVKGTHQCDFLIFLRDPRVPTKDGLTC